LALGFKIFRTYLNMDSNRGAQEKVFEKGHPTISELYNNCLQGLTTTDVHYYMAFILHNHDSMVVAFPVRSLGAKFKMKCRIELCKGSKVMESFFLRFSSPGLFPPRAFTRKFIAREGRIAPASMLTLVIKPGIIHIHST